MLKIKTKTIFIFRAYDEAGRVFPIAFQVPVMERLAEFLTHWHAGKSAIARVWIVHSLYLLVTLLPEYNFHIMCKMFPFVTAICWNLVLKWCCRLMLKYRTEMVGWSEQFIVIFGHYVTGKLVSVWTACAALYVCRSISTVYRQSDTCLQYTYNTDTKTKCTNAICEKLNYREMVGKSEGWYQREGPVRGGSVPSVLHGGVLHRTWTP